jgi:hypothetical protein
MLHNKRPSVWFPILATAFVTACAYSSTRIWATLSGSPFAHEVALSVALGAAALSAMAFGVAWNGIIVTLIDQRTNTGTSPPAPVSRTPPGYQSLDYDSGGDIHPSTNPNQVVISLGDGSGVILDINQEQLRYVAGLLRNRTNLPVNIYGEGTPMQREDVTRLRKALVRNKLARETQSGRVILIPVARNAILQAAATSPFR